MMIGLSGYARTGKDTAAQILAERGFRRVAFADRVRSLALRLDAPTRAIVGALGWEEAKSHAYVREYLQTLGMAVREEVGEDAWIRAALRDRRGDLVISDVRFRNEADAIRAAGGVIWRIERSGISAANGHVSEHEMDGYRYDSVIRNDGDLNGLHEAVLYMLDRTRPMVHSSL